MRKFLKTVSLFAVALGLYGVGKSIAYGVAAARPSAAEIIDAELQREPLRSIRTAMFTYFPAEAMEVRAVMVRAVERGRLDDEARERLASELRAVTAPVLGLMAFATDAEVRPLLDDKIALFTRLSPDPAACGQAVVRGMTAELMAHPLMDAQEFRDGMHRLYHTLSQARYRSLAPVAASDEDYEAFGALLAATSLSDEDFAAMEAVDPANTRLCGATITTLEVLRDADFPGAAAVRREMMLEMISG